jgi:hypothetical protein
MAKMSSAIGVGVEGASLFSCSAGERKIMNHFVVNALFSSGSIFGCGVATLCKRSRCEDAP